MSRSRIIRRVSVTAAIVAAAALTTSRVTTRSSSSDVSNDLRRAIDGGRAKNVILFLGDGMGRLGDHRRTQLPGRREWAAVDGLAAIHR